jgi:hypothetical protein
MTASPAYVLAADDVPVEPDDPVEPDEPVEELDPLVSDEVVEGSVVVSSAGS